MILTPKRRGFALAILAALLLLLPVASTQAATAQTHHGWTLQEAFWSFVGPWLARWAPEKIAHREGGDFDPTGPPSGRQTKVGSDADPYGEDSPTVPLIEVGGEIDPYGGEGAPSPDSNG